MYKFKAELTCSICYSIFEDPRVLPCSHTFCRKCLENVLQASGNLTCPACKRIIEIPAPGIESLPINLVLRAIVKKYKLEDPSDVIMCPEHSSQPLNVFCLRDYQQVCGHCLTIGQHQGHPIGDLYRAFKGREDLSEYFEQLFDTVSDWDDTWLLINKLENEKSHLEQMVHPDNEILFHYLKELRLFLGRKKKALMSALAQRPLEICSREEEEEEEEEEAAEEEEEKEEAFAAFGVVERDFEYVEMLENEKSHLEQMVHPDNEILFHYLKELRLFLGRKKKALMSALAQRPLEICSREEEEEEAAEEEEEKEEAFAAFGVVERDFEYVEMEWQVEMALGEAGAASWYVMMYLEEVLRSLGEVEEALKEGKEQEEEEEEESEEEEEESEEED
ncbi:tripartite motif-containing protein 59-like isoform X1 [Monodelphis domestica]|uniref:tripartite motif-containing protein 59-like isoform X1 n=1 Tax=Monodelphis domestica TaxID=13616 RepID=UPI0024E2296D|nr:tripartite motif-containing protein 59-like isoform X1 [Monodelphis domestica]